MVLASHFWCKNHVTSLKDIQFFVLVQFGQEFDQNHLFTNSLSFPLEKYWKRIHLNIIAKLGCSTFHVACFKGQSDVVKHHIWIGEMEKYWLEQYWSTWLHSATNCLLSWKSTCCQVSVGSEMYDNFPQKSFGTL